jgi:hypothetical protein
VQRLAFGTAADSLMRPYILRIGISIGPLLTAVPPEVTLSKMKSQPEVDWSTVAASWAA